jgi:hypothetical protein
MPYTPGPYLKNHGYLQWGGSLPGGEIWSCGMRFGSFGGDLPGIEGADNWFDGGDPGNYAEDTLLPHYETCVKDFHSRPASQISNRCQLQFVKFNLIGIDGNYMLANTFGRYFANLAGGSGYLTHPGNQVCLAVTLTTSIQRGPGSKGRFYMPLPMVPVQADGRIDEGSADGILASARTFIEDLADVPGVDAPNDPSPAIMSRKAGSPTMRKIQGVRIGRVLDTQRRRRGSLSEGYRSDIVDQGGF